MRELTKFFVRNYKFTAVLTMFLIIMGILGLKQMNAESYPAVNFATAVITTAYDGATASDIETKITKPIEDEIRTVSGLKDVRSISQSGLSTIVIRVDMDKVKDVSKVLNDVQKAVDRVSKLPNDLRDQPLYKEINSQEFPVYEFALIGDNTNRFRDHAADELKEELEDNSRVLGVRLVGFNKRAFQIKLIPQKLKLFHISINEVLAAIRSRNLNSPGGNLKQAEEQQLLRVEGKIKDTKELGEVVIRSNFNGNAITLKDVAEVVDSEEEPTVIAAHNGEPATIVVVTKKAGTDTIKLVKEITEKLKDFEKR